MCLVNRHARKFILSLLNHPRQTTQENLQGCSKEPFRCEGNICFSPWCFSPWDSSQHHWTNFARVQKVADRTNYARWILIHLRNMKSLPDSIKEQWLDDWNMWKCNSLFWNNRFISESFTHLTRTRHGQNCYSISTVQAAWKSVTGIGPGLR